MIRPFFEIRELRIGYGGHCLHQNAISTSIESGQWLNCIGENGSGKTTLLRTLTGYIPCVSGDVLIQGKSIFGMSIKVRSEWIAIATTERIALNGLCVKEIMDLNPNPKSSIHTIPEAFIRDVFKIAEIEDLPISSLSDGQYKRVMMARCILQQTPIILLDEPFAHLDPAFVDVIQETLTRCTQEFQRTIILTSHAPLTWRGDVCEFKMQ